MASVAILDDDMVVKLIYSASTPEAVMLNVSEGQAHVENPPPYVEGGRKFRYDEAEETFVKIEEE